MQSLRVRMWGKRRGSKVEWRKQSRRADRRGGSRRLAGVVRRDATVDRTGEEREETEPRRRIQSVKGQSGVWLGVNRSK
jgi:hypothetical protein